jgi:hypothetical protein
MLKAFTVAKGDATLVQDMDVWLLNHWLSCEESSIYFVNITKVWIFVDPFHPLNYTIWFNLYFLIYN